MKKNEPVKKNHQSIIKIFKMIASPKLTVVCLIILAILVFWGTVYQAENGLYQAQQKFFHSWFFIVFGFIPFPGTVLVLFILFFNLVFAIIYRIGFKLSKLGNLITHVGILVLLVGGFLTFYFSEESSLMLGEGQTSDMSSSRHLWELAIEEKKPGKTITYALDIDNSMTGEVFTFEELDLEIKVKNLYTNCLAYTGGNVQKNEIINLSGIQKLVEKPNSTEITENIAGGSFLISSLPDQTLLLYGQESTPTPIKINQNTLFFSLRRKKIDLPLSITLKDFRMKYYPNSSIVKSYESTVTIRAEGGIERDVVISMNKPLRFKNLTFFQSSYFIAKDSSEYTILAVVKNSGRLLPYFSSIIIFVGMVIHFLAMLFKNRKKTNDYIFSVFIILVTLSFSGNQLAFAEISSLEHLSKMAIMENGRIKPLDTFAQNILKQFSGRSSYQKKPAIKWLARLLFTPEASYDDKVFLITNPEVVDSIGVIRKGKARDRYSFSQLKEGLPKLRQLAINTSKIKGKERSFIENEINVLYNKLHIYQQLKASFNFLFPFRDLTITNTETLKILGFYENRKHFSFFDLAEKKGKIEKFIDSLKDKDREEWTAIEREIVMLSRRLEHWAKFYRELLLTIIPSSISAKKYEAKWLSPWNVASEVIFEGTPISKTLYLMRDFIQAYRNNEQENFDKSVIAFNKLILEKAGDRIRKNAISLEVFYNKLDPFYKSKFFYGFSILFLLLSFIILKKWFYRFGFMLLLAGFLLHIFGTLVRMYIMQRPPVTNLYETFVFTGLITVLLGMILEFFKKRNIGILSGSLAGLIMLMIAGKYALEGDTMGMLVAVLDSNFWLAAHVITIILGYAGIVLSGFIGHIYILQKISRSQKKGLLKNTFNAVYAIQAFGIIFTFLGTVLGGIWADQSWGRFWGWDPKENGALLILLWSAILFHAKKAKWIKDTGMAFGTIIGVIAISLAWFGVNLLGVGLHSYGFTSGIAKALFIFICFEMLFITVTAILLNTPLGSKLLSPKLDR